jgi:DNA-directed RNA polymerase beta' subunit
MKFAKDRLLKSTAGFVHWKQTGVLGRLFRSTHGSVGTWFDLSKNNGWVGLHANSGYFGHVEMAKPVFFIQYLNTVQKSCVVFVSNAANY